MEKRFEGEQEAEIDLLELAAAVLEHWKSLILVTVLCAALCFGYSKYMITPMYESSAELYVLTKSTSITSLADLQMGTSLTNDYVEVVLGRPVLDQVIENLSLDVTAKQLEGQVTLENPTNSRILRISVRDASPKMAKTIADEIAAVASDFIKEKMDQDAPTLIQSGYTDGAPVSPNIKKNTLLGGMLGACIVIAISVISYLLNDTIMTPEDMERKVGLNVLGSIPLEDSELNKVKSSKKKGTKKRKSAKKAQGRTK